MKAKILNFFTKLKPSKRKLIQVYAALLYNANMKGYISGEIFQGLSKSACVPGLNCYSCPGAIGACPLGSLQNALSASKTRVPTYILGIILLYSIILGRTICGFLCPVGLVQELLYKIKTPKLKKSKITRILSYFKYVILIVLVLILPLVYALQTKNMPLPAFCKYICPAGTLGGAVALLINPNNTSFFTMLGGLFTWKFILLVIFIAASIFIFRFFCRFFCPLGALYGFFNRLSIIGITVDKSLCNGCNSCVNNCKMDVLEVGDHECIQCGECKKGCPVNAIKWKSICKKVKKEIESEKQNSNTSIVESKKSNVNKKNLIISLSLLLSLIVVFCVVNFRRVVYDINDTITDFEITLNDSNTFDISTDSNATIIYFYKTLSNNEINTLKNYVNEKLNIILVGSFDSNNLTNEQINELTSLNIKLAKETKKNELIKDFNKKKEYPYSVFLDNYDKILITSTSMISGNDYVALIEPILSGKTVGHNVGDICYNKEIPLVNSDDKFQIIDQRGKITVINFWFTSCTPCVKELPHFDKIYKEYGDDLTVIAIHEANMYQNDVDAVKEFIETQFAGFTILFGYDDPNQDYYSILGGLDAWPTTIVVDQEGFIAYTNYKSMSYDELKTQIESLLK